uniref:Peroxisomal membrane protein 2 n=1 Tax=Arion vulgaris TaxID=1028688 RepID=A0A0B7AHZ9_9EUPU
MDKPSDKIKDNSLLKRALLEYFRLLQDRPVITKAATTAVVSAVGNILSQILAPDPATGGKINLRSVAAYSSFGFLVSGPLVHHFYAFLEKAIPKNSKNATLKRVLMDRLIFAPPLLLLFLYYVAILEGAGNKGAVKKIQSTYWMILKLNWTVWTFVQYININHVPLKYRTVFGNLCSLVWMTFISVKRRRAVQ